MNPNVAETSAGMTVWTLGLDEVQAQVLARAGFTLEPCKDGYDVAARIAGNPQRTRAVCLGLPALGTIGLRLVEALKVRGVIVWVAPGAKGKRADLALAAGARRWEEVERETGSAGEKIAGMAGEPPAARAATQADTATESEKSSERTRHTNGTPHVRPEPARREDVGEPIVVRIPSVHGNDALRPVRSDGNTPLARGGAADNAKVDRAKGSAVEGDMLARYDELTGEPLLTDDELKALLDDPAEHSGDSSSGAGP